MKNKKFQILSLAFFVVGILFLVNPSWNITGAVIGDITLPSTFSLILGLMFVTIGIVVLSEVETLEKRLLEVERVAVNEGEPTIIDTNYLIECCKNEKKYTGLRNFIQYNFDHGEPVIIPKKVYNELKNTGNTPGEKERIKLLREILPNQTVSVEDLDKKFLASKNKYDNLAQNILHQTPKYISFMYLSKVKQGESMDIEKFLNRNFGKLNDAFSREHYKSTLQDAERAYLNSKNKDKFLRGYNVGSADVDVLSGALFLQENPSIIANSIMDKVKIISQDSHLLDSLKILNRNYASKRGKISVMEDI